MNDAPQMTARELEIQRVRRRLRNSGILFHEDETIANKARKLLDRCTARLSSFFERHNKWYDARVKRQNELARQAKIKSARIFKEWLDEFGNADEQERHDSFEELCGGSDRAFRLMRLHEHGSEASFRKVAAAHGYNDAEINIFLELQ